MKHLFTLIFILTSLTTFGQNSKRIEGVYVQLNNQHPEKFILEDHAVKITFLSGYMQRMNFRIENKTDKSITVIWKDSYYVINGNTYPVDNAGVSKVAMGMISSNQVDNNAPQKIASKAGLEAKVGSLEKQIFNYNEINKYYKQQNKAIDNRIVLTLQVEGETKEYPITITAAPKKF